MHLVNILRVTGILLTLFSFVMLVPALLGWWWGESTTAFLTAFGITIVSGLVLWLPARGSGDLRSRDGFLVTILFYSGLGLFGAMPLFLAQSLDISFTHAAFESLSGLTTTGATVLTGLDDLPRSVLVYRQLLQWLGGMGIIVLAVAILPMLGIGGMQLYRAESPGPIKDKLTPRITETARKLWYIYLTLTIACGLGYWFAGMSLFDAICHAFSTVAIGGFSTHDASLGYFDNPAIESVAVVFMIIAGMNFGLHFIAWDRRSLAGYWADWEARFYLGVLALVAAVVVSFLLAWDATSSPVRDGIFQTVSIATTTGFVTRDFAAWPSVVPLLLLFAAFTGGCAASTAGGMKIYRVMLLYLQGFREIKRLIHPSGVFHIKISRDVVPDRVIEAVWGFFSVYVIVFLTMVCALLAVADVDFVTAFSAVGACLNNLGPGLGSVAANYGDLNASAQWLLVLAMLLGRLEIFPLLVLLTPAFWKR